MNKKDFLFLLHQYRGQDYVDIYPFNADNRKIESYFQEVLEKIEEQHKYHKQLEIQLENKIEDFVRTSESTLDSHTNDNTKHITATERNSWNAKETPSAAQQKATKALNEAKLYIDKHSNRTDNPHKVTKSQIGLGKVADYEVATKAEAEAGTSNNTYMTPLRVLESLIANAGDVLDDIVVMDEHLPSDAGMEDFPKGVSVGYTSVLGDNYPQRWGTLINFRSKSDLVMAQLWFGNGGGGGTVRHKLYYRIYNRNGTGLVNGWTPWYKIIDELDVSDSISSTSRNTVATSNAVKKAYDKALEVRGLAEKAQKTADEAVSKIPALSSSVVSTSTVTAANSYAVKRAYDKASEALTLGNRRKKEVVDGLLSVNESLPITQSSSWDTVIRNIENAGIPYVVTEFFDEGILNVKNLNFTPDVFAILSKPDYRQTPSIIIKKDRDGKIFYQLTNDSNVIRIYKDGFDVRDALSLLGYSGGHLIALGTGIAKELGYNLKIEN